MGLIGTVADFTLIELLQLAALARKTGILELRHRRLTAWVGIHDGAIVRFARSDRELDPDPADPEGSAINELLSLLAWEPAEFSFETASDPEVSWPVGWGLRLETPISIQFLALEGMRLEDENHIEALGDEAVDARSWGSDEAAAPSDGVPPARREEARPEPSRGGATRSEAHEFTRAPAALIIVDADLRLLERLKHSLAQTGLPTHIFQNPADGLARLRQYLSRGDIPAVVLGASTTDPIEPRRKPGWRVFAQRIHSLAPAVRLAVLSADAAVAESDAGRATALTLPSDPDKSDIDSLVRKLAQSLGLKA
jgi:hypothetical protein